MIEGDEISHRSSFEVDWVAEQVMCLSNPQKFSRTALIVSAGWMPLMIARVAGMGEIPDHIP
jgi:hypothetical protein